MASYPPRMPIMASRRSSCRRNFCWPSSCLCQRDGLRDEGAARQSDGPIPNYEAAATQMDWYLLPQRSWKDLELWMWQQWWVWRPNSLSKIRRLLLVWRHWRREMIRTLHLLQSLGRQTQSSCRRQWTSCHSLEKNLCAVWGYAR